MVMEKGVKITIVVAVTLIILVLLIGFGIYSLIPDTVKGQTVNVEGSSIIKVDPNVVSIYFNIETSGNTSQEANEANSVIADNLLFSLVRLGFEKKSLETMGFNIYEDQRWENGKYKSYGFKASHQVRVVLGTNEASKIGSVIDAGVDAGALLQWINFELSNDKQNEYKAQALKEASQDAKTKAEAIAEGLGLEVKKVVSISTSQFNYSPWNLYTAKAGGMLEDASQAKVAATNIQPGTQDVTGYVSVTYKLG
jgi:uncharacterized protein YggE